MTPTRRQHVGPYKLTPDERRQAVIEALRPRANKTAIAKRYGISRESLYKLIERALRDPKGNLREAERELEFRREVLKMSRIRRKASGVGSGPASSEASRPSQPELKLV